MVKKFVKVVKKFVKFILEYQTTLLPKILQDPMGGGREVIVYVMRKMKITKRTDGQFSGGDCIFQFRPPKKKKKKNRFCVFEKSFYSKCFSKK